MKKMFGLIVGSALVAGCGKKGSEAAFEMPPVPVQTAEVAVRDVPLYFEAVGTLKPSSSAEVRAQVSGILKEVHFKEGERVEEGALLYTVDEAPYLVRVQECEAQLAQEIAHLENAKKKLERYKSLSRQDLIAKVEWDEMETQVALHKAMVQANEARLAAAQLDLERCEITAPIAGYAGKSALGVGNMAGAGTLVVITEAEPLEVDFSITEDELKKIVQAGPAVEVYLSGCETACAKGKVYFLDHALNPKTGLLSASAVLDKGHAPLWPGQSVRVHVYFGKKQQARVIPVRAVKTNQEGPYIFAVKEDGTVELRSIKLGFEEKGQIVVEEGLDGTGKVVTEGHTRLFPGSKVKEAQ